MRRPLLLAPPIAAALLSVSAGAEPNLPVPVVTATCNHLLQTVVTVVTAPNTNYVFHFRHLSPPPVSTQDIARHTTSTVATFMNLTPGTWTMFYNIPAKGSPTRMFTVPVCGPSRVPVTRVPASN